MLHLARAYVRAVGSHDMPQGRLPADHRRSSSSASLVYSGRAAAGRSYSGHGAGDIVCRAAATTCSACTRTRSSRSRRPLRRRKEAHQDGRELERLPPASYKTGNGQGNGLPKHRKLQNWEVPCAVCQTEDALRIYAAGSDCPAEWTKEYDGFIYASHHGHLEERVGLHRLQRRRRARGLWRGQRVPEQDYGEGMHLYPTEAESGRTGRATGTDWELSCSVCSLAQMYMPGPSRSTSAGWGWRRRRG